MSFRFLRKARRDRPLRANKYLLTKQTLFDRPVKVDNPDYVPPRKRKRQTHRYITTKQTLYERPRAIRVYIKKKSIGFNPRIPLMEEVPGYTGWLQSRIAQMAQFRNKLGFPDWRRTGTPDGMNKRQAAAMWAEARRKAKIDMENMEKAGLLHDADEVSREATEETLTVLRSNVGADTKLKAANLLLNFYKSKPVLKTETKIDAAMDFLAQVAEDIG